MSFKKYFELRGSLAPKERIILTIIGILILSGCWFFLAEALSKQLITQNETIEISSLSLEQRKYYENDSLLIANYNELELLKTEELKQYGLKKEKVYPLLPPPSKVLKSFPELNEKDDVIGNTFFLSLIHI